MQDVCHVVDLGVADAGRQDQIEDKPDDRPQTRQTDGFAQGGERAGALLTAFLPASCGFGAALSYDRLLINQQRQRQVQEHQGSGQAVGVVVRPVLGDIPR